MNHEEEEDEEEEEEQKKPKPKKKKKEKKRTTSGELHKTKATDNRQEIDEKRKGEERGL